MAMRFSKVKKEIKSGIKKISGSNTVMRQRTRTEKKIREFIMNADEKAEIN